MSCTERCTEIMTFVSRIVPNDLVLRHTIIPKYRDITTERHWSKCFLTTIQSLFRGLDKSCQVWNSSYRVSTDLLLMMRMRPLSEHAHHETNNSRLSTKLWLILFEGETESAIHDVADFPGRMHVKKPSRFRPFTIPSDLADRITWVNLVTSHDFMEVRSLFT